MFNFGVTLDEPTIASQRRRVPLRDLNRAVEDIESENVTFNFGVTLDEPTIASQRRRVSGMPQSRVSCIDSPSYF